MPLRQLYVECAKGGERVLFTNAKLVQSVHHSAVKNGYPTTPTRHPAGRGFMLCGESSAEYRDKLLHGDACVAKHAAQCAGRDVAPGVDSNGCTAAIGMFQDAMARAALSLFSKSEPQERSDAVTVVDDGEFRRTGR